MSHIHLLSHLWAIVEPYLLILGRIVSFEIFLLSSVREHRSARMFYSGEGSVIRVHGYYFREYFERDSG